MKSKIKAKVKAKVNAKVNAKIKKAKAKIAKKCAILFALAFSLAFVGCQNPAQRAQTAETNIYVYEGATVTFGSDFVSLAQANETGGNDAGLTASPTTSTDVPIAIDVPVNKANSGSSSAAVGAAEKLLGAGADYLAEKMTENGTENAAQNSAQNECPNGDCSTCSDGACTPPQN